MSKVKSDITPHYELLYLISNKYSEGELDTIKAKVVKLINNHQGVITHTDDIGKRRLAYAIKGFRYGYYQLVEFDLAGLNLKALENDLKLDHEVLRHQIIRRPLRSAEQIAKDAEAALKRVAVGQAPQTVETETETKAEETKPAVVSEVKETAPTAKEAEPEVKEAMSSEELDNKLDKILDSDMLYK